MKFNYNYFLFFLFTVINSKSPEEQLVLAIQSNNLSEMEKLIVEKRVVVNAAVTTQVSGKNYTISFIDLTIYHQRFRAMKLLIKHGAPIFGKNKLDACTTAYNLALQLNKDYKNRTNVEVNKKITKSCRIYKYLEGLNFFYAIQNNNPQQLQELKQRLISYRDIYARWIHIRDPKTGQTPLHAAALHGDIGLIDGLIKCGADLTIKDFSGKTALKLAEQRDYAAYQHLLGYKIHILINNYLQGDDPLENLPQRLQKKIIKLLKLKASINIKDPISKLSLRDYFYYCELPPLLRNYCKNKLGISQSCYKQVFSLPNFLHRPISDDSDNNQTYFA